MLDTVQIKHYFRKPLNETELRERGAKPIRNRRNMTFVMNPERGMPLPKLTIILTPDGIMHVSAEVSLPRIIFGHNARLPTQAETDFGLAWIGRFVETKTELEFDAETATVSLIHFAKDVHLGEPGVFRAVKSLATKKLSRMTKTFVQDTTLYFINKGRSKQVRIYPKLQEVLAAGNATAEAIEAARGNLRFEVCLLKSRSLIATANRLGLPDKTALSLLKETTSQRLISEVQNDLGFSESIDERSNLEMLLESYSIRKAMKLNSFLEMRYLYGDAFYLDPEHNYSKYAFDRDARECRKANVWTPTKCLE